MELTFSGRIAVVDLEVDGLLVQKNNMLKKSVTRKSRSG